MDRFSFRSTIACTLVLAAFAAQALSSQGQPAASQSRAPRPAASAPAQPAWLADELRADMGFLASDELHGRGSASREEHIAAQFAAARFEALGLSPAGDNGSFVMRVPLPSPLPERAQQRLSEQDGEPRTETWNAVAMLPGRDPALGVILLTAHLDHLGMGAPDDKGDRIYNGADDDASGTSAVLALARALAQGAGPRRTVVFALFGSEEIGGYGNAGFLAHPPVPLDTIVANLEFEMIGRADPVVGEDKLWLTGYERSNLGPEMARHGAPLVADPRPEQKFFQRSDNIALARRGIVAQTVSSFGLHKDYHRPSDELSTIDFAHMEHAVSSMIEPIRWLADTDWRPAWNPGGKP